MGVKAFDQSTLDALNAQGDDKEKTPGHKDINIVDLKDVPKDIPKDAPQSTEDILAAAGIDIKGVKDQITKDGKISDDLKKDLTEKLPDLDIDKYIQDFNAKVITDTDLKVTPVDATKVADMNTFIYDSVGGEDNFKTMAGILKDNVSKEDIDIINAKLRSDSKVLVKDGLQSIVKAYKKAIGTGVQLMEGDPGSTQADTFVFMTKDQYHQIMRTEKYKTDYVFKKKVDDTRMKSRNLDKANTMPGQYFNRRNGQLYAL